MRPTGGGFVKDQVRALEPPLDRVDIFVARAVRAAGRRCVTYQADVRDFDAMVSAVKETVATLGRLDTVVATAGVISSGKAGELSREAWDTVLGVNLTGIWNTARAAIPELIGAGRGGSIVDFGSNTIPGISPECSSRGPTASLGRSASPICAVHASPWASTGWP